MAVYQESLRIATKGHTDARDITREVERAVRASGVRTGTVTVTATGSTTGITTIEFEPGAVRDLREALDRLAPVHDNYHHNERWGDHNGYAHLRSALMGTARTFAVRNGAPSLGTWQQILFLDFDDRARDREIVVTVIGE